MTPVSDPLFTTIDDGMFQPGALTRGPWSPDAQHGGAPAALLARAVEAVAADQPMQVARMTVELVRPVPLTPLRVTTSIERPGRKIQLVAASIHAGPSRFSSSSSQSKVVCFWSTATTASNSPRR